MWNLPSLTKLMWLPFCFWCLFFTHSFSKKSARLRNTGSCINLYLPFPEKLVDTDVFPWQFFCMSLSILSMKLAQPWMQLFAFLLCSPIVISQPVSFPAFLYYLLLTICYFDYLTVDYLFWGAYAMATNDSCSNYVFRLQLTLSSSTAENADHFLPVQVSIPAFGIDWL